MTKLAGDLDADCAASGDDDALGRQDLLAPVADPGIGLRLRVRDGKRAGPHAARREDQEVKGHLAAVVQNNLAASLCRCALDGRHSTDDELALVAQGAVERDQRLILELALGRDDEARAGDCNRLY